MFSLANVASSPYHQKPLPQEQEEWEAGRKQLQNLHYWKAKPVRANISEGALAVGMAGEALMLSPEEHMSRKLGKQMEP